MSDYFSQAGRDDAVEANGHMLMPSASQIALAGPKAVIAHKAAAEAAQAELLWPICIVNSPSLAK